MFKVINLFLRILPSKIGAALVIWLIERSTRYTPKATEDLSAVGGKKYKYFKNNWAWRLGSGDKVIVLVHGWGGAASQWTPLALSLSKQGFSVIVPDISAHGASAGSKIKFEYFSRDIACVLESIDDKNIFALIGHSAGGLSMMSGRSVHNYCAQHYICIATPSAPYPPIKVASKKLKLSKKILKLLHAYYAAQFGLGWSEITISAFKKNPKSSLVLIYDNQDRYLNGRDVEEIKLAWPDAKVYLTDGLGHESIIRDSDTHNQIINLLTASPEYRS